MEGRWGIADGWRLSIASLALAEFAGVVSFGFILAVRLYIYGVIEGGVSWNPQPCNDVLLY